MRDENLEKLTESEICLVAKAFGTLIAMDSGKTVEVLEKTKKYLKIVGRIRRYAGEEEKTNE